MIDTDVDPAEFPAVKVYVACGTSAVGVPEKVHVGDMTSPAGRAVAEVSTQEVTAVPPVQTIVRGWTMRERQ